MEKTLHLSLKYKWFDLIAKGEKREEYRGVKLYYIKKFTKNENVKSPEWVGFTHVCFHKGRTGEKAIFKIVSFSIGRGKTEWGAPNEEVFIIKFDDDDTIRTK